MSSVSATERFELRPEGCITMNAKWVLPWMWKRRNTDLEFIMLVTCEWMLALCRAKEELMDEHPVFEVMKKHGVILSVFTVSLSRGRTKNGFTDRGVKGLFQTHFHIRLYIEREESGGNPNSRLSAFDSDFAGDPSVVRFEDSRGESAALHADHTVLCGLTGKRVDPNFL